MKTLLVTQRVVENDTYPERRDALDQKWHQFLHQFGFVPVLLPNNIKVSQQLMESVHFDGILLTGGNSLSGNVGLASERDELEYYLLDRAKAEGAPVLGICRGMQVVQTYFGASLSRVEGHVTDCQKVSFENSERMVNSYHEWGTREATPDLEVWARSEDGMVKAVHHITLPITGIMWHPERLLPFEQDDADIFYQRFEGRLS